MTTQPNNKWLKVFTLIFEHATYIFTYSFLTMVILGALHSSISAVPNLSYWETFGFAYLLYGLFGMATYTVRRFKKLDKVFDE